ncbi:hypothetical protein Tco_0209301 [Tanacetum coccineum]
MSGRTRSASGVNTRTMCARGRTRSPSGVNTPTMSASGINTPTVVSVLPHYLQEVKQDCHSVSSIGGKKSTICGKKSTIEASTPSSPIVGFEMSTSYGARMRGVGMRMIGSGMRSRGNSHPGNSPTKSATNEAESRGLRTINGKVVRSSGREDGSRSRMYPNEIRPI